MKKVVEWFKNNKKIVIIAGILLIAIIAIGVCVFLFTKESQEKKLPK